MCMFCRSLFVLLYIFFFAIVFYVLFRYKDSDYPFGIFKLFTQTFEYTGHTSPGTGIEPATLMVIRTYYIRYMSIQLPHDVTYGNHVSMA